MATRMRNGLSSIVGLVLLLLALIVISSTIYSILHTVNENAYMNLRVLDRKALRNSVKYLVECVYKYIDNTAIITLVNNLPEPFQIVGYVIVYNNITFETVRLAKLEVVPPLTNLSLSLNLAEEPRAIFIVILIRDEVTHLIVRKSTQP
ncbi:MAG: hypothetical protein QW267_06875 [Sulfolobales archaeon]